VAFMPCGFSDLSVDPDIVKEKSKKWEDSSHQQLLPDVAENLEKNFKKT